ncbi:MAG: DUF1403 family protein [Mesorhizobium sp.]|nr:MAG: DUF1403 family protein [Mesorhizobium sp.]
MHADRKSGAAQRPAPFVAAAIAARVFAMRPDAELLAWWLADLVLAQSLRWPRRLPLLVAQAFCSGLPHRGRRRQAHPAWRKKVLSGRSALHWAAAEACRLAAELSRRAEKLLAVAPKLRAKDGAGRAGIGAGRAKLPGIAQGGFILGAAGEPHARDGAFQRQALARLLGCIARVNDIPEVRIKAAPTGYLRAGSTIDSGEASRHGSGDTGRPGLTASCLHPSWRLAAVQLARLALLAALAFSALSSLSSDCRAALQPDTLS